MISRRERRRPLRRDSRNDESCRSGRPEIETEDPRHGSGIRQLVVLIALAFMVTLGVVVGTRLSSDAIAVLVGVIAGVAASIPCALLLMAVTRRQEERDEERWDEERYDERYNDPYGDPRRAVPPIIVVTPGQAATPQLSPWAGGAPNWSAWDEGAPAHSGQRTFRVMGYDESDDDE